MNPIQPMLAVPLDKIKAKIDWRDYVAERKYDGWRLIVEISGVHDGRFVRAWTRPRKHAGKTGKTMLEQTLPLHLQSALMSSLPPGVYDGELMNGRTSTDVKRGDLDGQQSFVVFDFLTIHQTSGDAKSTDLMARPYAERRLLLEDIFKLAATGTFRIVADPHVTLAESWELRDMDDVSRLAHEVWDAGGEGLILKRKGAPYQSGKRSKDFIKIKKLMTEVMIVVGFKPSRGEIVNRGPFAMVALEGVKGPTSVKTRNDEELEAFQRAWDQRSSVTTHTDDPHRLHPGGVKTPGCHPSIGRKLRVEFNDWTPEEGYRHPRWDRWENE